MRPVEKWPWPQENGENKSYVPHTLARRDLEDNLDSYCSYCEVFSSDLEVEHVIPQSQDSNLQHNWNNFLLACGRCNGRDNKSNKNVDLSSIHFPHRNNTMLSFEYSEGGFVRVNPALTGQSLDHARNLMELVGLNKRPGHENFHRNDSRWQHRRTTWELADKYLEDLVAGKLTAGQVVEFAVQRGFFSVWFSVFVDHPSVKKLLIERFTGTAHTCFEPKNNYQPLPRNPDHTTDPI